jgi:hypothetical protein
MANRSTGIQHTCHSTEHEVFPDTNKAIKVMNTYWDADKNVTRQGSMEIRNGLERGIR